MNFGGLDRVSERYVYYAKNFDDKGQGFEAYVPCRTAIVFKKVAD